MFISLSVAYHVRSSIFVIRKHRLKEICYRVILIARTLILKCITYTAKSAEILKHINWKWNCQFQQLILTIFSWAESCYFKHIILINTPTKSNVQLYSFTSNIIFLQRNLKKKVRWNANPNFNFVTFSVSILARLVQKIPIIILADVLANARLET